MSESSCCDKKCINDLSFSDINIASLLFNARYPTKKMKKQFILDYLNTHTVSSVEETIFFVSGSIICRNAWLMSHGLSQNLFEKATRLLKQGKIEVPISEPRKCTPKTISAMAWMANFFEDTCEKAPNSGHWYLPCFLTKDCVMKMYLESPQDEFVGHSTFNNLWNEHFKHVSIPKVIKEDIDNRFSKCDLCTAITEELQKEYSSEQKAQLKKMKTEHLDLQGKERFAYYRRVDRAKNNPGDFLSIIIDSMDQSKLLIPRFAYQRKATADAWLLRTHLIGATIHGQFSAGAFDLFQYAHDSNLTCNFLLNILLHAEYLPRRMDLQFDNCWRENKNKFVFGFLGLLIRYRVFDEICVHFLMRGHTHEDIDQLFSQYSKKFLKDQDIFTLEGIDPAPRLESDTFQVRSLLAKLHAFSHEGKYLDLMGRWAACVIRNRSPKVPLVYRTDHLFNIREWIQPHLMDFHGHTGPHVFRISSNENGDPVMRWKLWCSTDETWKPTEGIQIFRSYPDSSPASVVPCADKLNLNIVKPSIGRILTSEAVRVISEDTKVWWQEFWQNVDKMFVEPLTCLPWTFPQLVEKATASIQKSLQWVPHDGLQQLQQSTDSPSVEIVVGYQSKSTRQVVDVDDADVNLHDMVALFQSSLYHDFKKAIPLIGQAITIQKTDDIQWVKVEMWSGSYSGKWKVMPAKRHEWVTKDAVVLYGFELTPKGCLREPTKEKLREIYSELLKGDDEEDEEEEEEIF